MEQAEGGARRAAVTGALLGTAVLLGVAGGLGLAALGHWRGGVYAVGLAVLLGAGLRLSLPERAVGLLAVRGRGFDGAVLLVLGFGLLLLGNSVPTG